MKIIGIEEETTIAEIRLEAVYMPIRDKRKRFSKQIILQRPVKIPDGMEFFTFEEFPKEQYYAAKMTGSIDKGLFSDRFVCAHIILSK